MGLARSIVARLRHFAGDRRRAKRQKVRLAFSIFRSDPSNSRHGSRRISRIDGHTLDISLRGMALILPTILLGDHHLVGENRSFHLNLELPSGPIDMKVSPVRYVSLDDHGTETGFLLGVRIMEMEEADRLRFVEYISVLTARRSVGNTSQT